MSITYALLKNRLDEISPVICKRIEKEMDKRIITPFLTRDVWWMAENLDLSFWNINNWTTACCYDILFIILAMKYDKKTAFKAINKAIDCMDVFVDSYPDDGACDEGPGYWGGSIHNLMSFLELLEHVIGGKTNIWKQRKLEQMCEYILHMRIHNGIYASVADSHPHIEVNLSRLLMMYHEGKLFDNEAMMQEAIQLYPLLESEKRYPYDFMTEFTYWEEIKNGIAKPSDVPKSAWISGIEFLSSHECIDTGKGMYLGIKGGTNMESHNHNDIGSFIVYKNGKPVIVDAGIGLYTNTTFGEKRYTNWWANGFHHNIPVIGGVEQIEGAYSAKDVSCSLSEAEDSVCMELTDAYRNSDKIKKLFRKAVLNRTNSHVIVEDTFEFTDTIEYASVLLLYHEPKITPSGFGCGEADIQIEGPEYEIEVTDIDLSYDSIFCGEENWNTNTLYRVLIRFKSSAKSNVRITIS